MLLSMGALVVTAQVAAEDLAEYQDMLIVEPHICHRKWSAHVESLLFTNGSNDSMSLDRWRIRAAREFRKRFAPKALLGRAGVWSTRLLRTQQYNGYRGNPRPVADATSCLVEGRMRVLSFTSISENVHALPPVHKLLSMDKVLEERWLRDIAILRVQSEYCARRISQCAGLVDCAVALHPHCKFGVDQA
jgi:hypothetical protein